MFYGLLFLFVCFVWRQSPEGPGSALKQRGSGALLTSCVSISQPQEHRHGSHVLHHTSVTTHAQVGWVPVFALVVQVVLEAFRVGKSLAMATKRFHPAELQSTLQRGLGLGLTGADPTIGTLTLATRVVVVVSCQV